MGPFCFLFSLTKKIFFRDAVSSKPSSSAKSAKDKQVNGVNVSKTTADVGSLVEDLLNRTSSLLLSEVSTINASLQFQL